MAARAAPSGTPAPLMTNRNGKAYSVPSRRIGEVRVLKVCSAGTNRSSVVKSWLPLPRRPVVVQVSRMVQRSAGR